jgi:hypothetical protein
VIRAKKIRAGPYLLKIHSCPDYAVVIIVSLLLLSFPAPSTSTSLS